MIKINEDLFSFIGETNIKLKIWKEKKAFHDTSQWFWFIGNSSGLFLKRGGRNVKNQNIEGSERWKYF
jgi:hypothetical protein